MEELGGQIYPNLSTDSNFFCNFFLCASICLLHKYEELNRKKFRISKVDSTYYYVK